jgi:ATP-dependent exoDNAse (exonuclease V) beta subunit
MTSQPLSDQTAREQALDTSLSCIVQAPAGSGKTELLTLRYLKLLCLCEQPEEVLAITFTRKAASEMQHRILKTLQRARQWQQQGIPESSSKLDLERHEIALGVLRRNDEKHWRLLDNPARLRVQTIDSFCHYLASQLPVLSRIGGAPNVSEDVDDCLQDAIDNTLAKLDSDSPLAAPVAQLLLHLDNNRNRVQALLTSLLHKRDQWLSYVLEIHQSPEQARHYLQSSLEELIFETLSKASDLLAGQQQDLLALLNFSRSKLAEANGDETTVQWIHFPGCNSEALEQWRQLTQMLLTQQGQFRKTVDKRQGFPAGKKGPEAEMKSRIRELLAAYAEDEDLRLCLNEIQLMPVPEFGEEQWQFLVSLLQVLSDLALELQLSFRRFGRIDHSQTSAAARSALGSPDDPTDIALALDHKLSHILVDEFQDTSQLQLELLQQLTSGWQPGDGRSLFLVGDAMQSCYSFRNANVGIYLNVRENGINDIEIQPLTLSANFRSQAAVVNWVNSIFSEAFPAAADVSRGAVPYSDSTAVHPQDQDYQISASLIRYGDGERELAFMMEAEQAVARIRLLQALDPGSDIAILARARSHFSDIIAALRQAGIQWQATEIDSLASVPVVEDLLSLTRALINPADRLAWLAVLRAPWCGLDASALLSLCRSAGERSLYSTLKDSEAIARLDSDAQARLQALIEVLDYGYRLRMHCSLRELVEACWTLLRGIDTASDSLQQECIGRFFALLEEQEDAGSLDSLDRFKEKLAQAWVPPAIISHETAQNQGSVQLLTMHKSKGLEFDHVILPGLSRGTGRDDKPLLQWHERLNRDGEPRLFLAALTATGKDDDKLYQYIRAEQKLKSELENTRLLYIAVTRAIKSATLLASLAVKNPGDESEELKDPPGNSLLARIWPQLQSRHDCLDWLQAEPGAGSTEPPENAPRQNLIRRFASPVQLLEQERQLMAGQLEALQVDASDEEEKEEESSDSLAALSGDLVHQGLEYYTRLTDKPAFASHLDGLRRYWQSRFRRFGLTEEQVSRHCAAVEKQLLDCSNDQTHAWIFDHSQQDSECELALLSVREGVPRQFVVDRSFVDAEGTRWIIDYKTGLPAAEQSESEFTAAQLQRHEPQLQRYRELFAAMESRPARSALYLTALNKLAVYE